MEQAVLEYLDPAVWRAKLDLRKVRTIAAIFSHVHNVRRKWLRLSAPHLQILKPLNRTDYLQKETAAALAESAARCCEMLTEALTHPEGRIQTFRRDTFAKPWPMDQSAIAYMLSHDAHHRGQACLLARQLGYPLPAKATSRMWSWESLRSSKPGA